MKNLGVLALTIVFLSLSTRMLAQTNEPLPTLRGNKAIGKLNQLGQFDSLSEAFTQAREDESKAGPGIVKVAIRESAKVLASDATTEDQFGYSVAISGDTAIVGAHLEDTSSNTDNGAAYVFVRSATGWTEQAKLLASDASSSDFFGFSVAISGDTAIVGAWDEDTSPNSDNGAAYVFVRSGATWTEQTKLLASDSASSDLFGFSVAISGDTAIVGALGEDTRPNSSNGAAYVFVRSGATWTEQTKLLASNASTSDNFGRSVAVSGDAVIVGAPNQSTWPNNRNGAAYVFVRNGTTWTEQAKLIALDAAPIDLFGYSVAISGDTVIVGAYRANIAPYSSGAAYVFVRSGATWTEQAKLIASDRYYADTFGWSVAISGDTAIIGAYFKTTWPELDNGAAYVFVRSGSMWTEQKKLLASDTASFEHFGFSVAISGDTAIVGATYEDTAPNTNNGAAYFFVSVPVAPPSDFDGDGKTDISIFRPSNGQWWLNRSNLGTIVHTFGNSADRLVPGDFTGDGVTDVAIFRPSIGEWFVLRSENLTFFSFPFGIATDIPVPADYDGDNKTDPAIFRPSTSTWFISRSSDGGTTIATFGAAGDIPVPADYDGDGKVDIAIYRPSLGQWWLNRSTAGIIATTFGVSTDRVVPGDYTGDGKADVALFRPASGEWLILRSENFSFYSFPFGNPTDTPAPGDYDGDGRFDAAVFRSSAATWYVQRSTAGTLIQTFGATTDIPVPNAFVR